MSTGERLSLAPAFGATAVLSPGRRGTGQGPCVAEPDRGPMSCCRIGINGSEFDRMVVLKLAPEVGKN